MTKADECKNRWFKFKSNTDDGRIGHFEVIVNDSAKSLMVVKKILSKDNIAYLGFTLIRESKWGNVYQQVMSLKFNSLATITYGVFNQINQTK